MCSRPAFGGLVGTGPGAGMALLLIISGLAPALIAGLCYLIPAVRDAETLLPDHEAAPDPASTGNPTPAPA